MRFVNGNCGKKYSIRYQIDEFSEIFLYSATEYKKICQITHKINKYIPNTVLVYSVSVPKNHLKTIIFAHLNI